MKKLFGESWPAWAMAIPFAIITFGMFIVLLVTDSLTSDFSYTAAFGLAPLLVLLIDLRGRKGTGGSDRSGESQRTSDAGK